MFSPQNEWTMKPAKKGEIVRLVIEDAFEPQRGIGGKTTGYTRVPAAVLAEDLLREWRSGHRYTESMDPDARIGLWICEEQDGLTDEAIKSSSLYLEVVRKQEALARAAVAEADVFWVNPEQRKWVTRIHHVLAEWLGVKGHSWQTQEGDAGKKACPLCTTMIGEAAIICPHCGHVVDPAAYQRITEASAAAGVPLKPKPEMPARRI